MSIEYLGLSRINGPLVVLEGVRGAAYDEIVEFTVDGKEKRLGRIIEDYEDKAVIQVFEGTDGMSLTNTHTVLTGHPMELAVSSEILGRTFDGIGRPIDGLGPVRAEARVNVNGLPLNPCRREYPRNYINTGFSAIDGLTSTRFLQNFRKSKMISSDGTVFYVSGKDPEFAKRLVEEFEAGFRRIKENGQLRRIREYYGIPSETNQPGTSAQ